MSTLLKVKNIKKDNILNSVSFEMMSGEMIAIMGPSGSGKSTLLYNISGMDQADGGEVWLGDTEIVHLSEDDKAKLRLNRMGFVFQHFHIGDIAEKRIREVSGGQLQRACICRSMIVNPEIIFADEPTGALNRTSAAEVMEAFLRINRKGATIMMVTHDSWIASKCERIIYLLDGEIRGELRLGKSMPEDGKEREQKLVRWLEEFGW